MATYDLNTTIPSKIAKGDILNYPYTQSMGVGITLPKGEYKLEVWGAQGGSYSSYLGGYGGYSHGILTLLNDTIVFLQPGSQPSTVTTNRTIVLGGYNGGGNGANRDYQETYTYGQGGGGGSDIRIGQDSPYARVIVAGGGGGSASVSNYYNKSGGGLTGNSPYGNFQSTQISAGSGGSFGQGANVSTSVFNYMYGAGGGGGGWYGGGADSSYSDTNSSLRDSNGGGSGYVYTESTASNYPSGCLLNSDYYLADAETIAGSSSFIDYSGSTVTGHQGHGACRITVLSLPIPPPVIWFKNSDNIWQKMN